MSNIWDRIWMSYIGAYFVSKISSDVVSWGSDKEILNHRYNMKGSITGIT